MAGEGEALISAWSVSSKVGAHTGLGFPGPYHVLGGWEACLENELDTHSCAPPGVVAAHSGPHRVILAT